MIFYETECIVSRLFTEMLTDNEGLTIFGTKQFSNYSGYSKSFKYEKSISQEERICHMSVLDAISFSRFPKRTQFYKEFIIRELSKALLCFDFAASKVSSEIENLKTEINFKKNEIPELWVASGFLNIFFEKFFTIFLKFFYNFLNFFFNFFELF